MIKTSNILSTVTTLSICQACKLWFDTLSSAITRKKKIRLQLRVCVSGSEKIHSGVDSLVFFPLPLIQTCCAERCGYEQKLILWCRRVKEGRACFLVICRSRCCSMMRWGSLRWRVQNFDMRYSPHQVTLSVLFHRFRACCCYYPLKVNSVQVFQRTTETNLHIDVKAIKLPVLNIMLLVLN